MKDLILISCALIVLGCSGEERLDGGGNYPLAENKDLCPLNSGWPCGCDRIDGTCDDGRPCREASFIGNFDDGICLPPCNDLQCPTHEVWGNGEPDVSCIIDHPISYCFLACDDDEQCPPGQVCALEVNEYTDGHTCLWDYLPELQGN